MRSLKYIKSCLLPISISLSPVHSLDDGTCHKHSLVGAGETIASPGPRAACLWDPVQRVSPKVFRVII